jgi:hypothetical protein
MTTNTTTARVIHQIDNRPEAERTILIVYRIDEWAQSQLVKPTRVSSVAFEYELQPGYYEFRYNGYRNGAWRTVELAYQRVAEGQVEPVSATTLRTALWGSDDPWRGLTPLIVTEECGCDRFRSSGRVVRWCPDHRLQVAVTSSNKRADQRALVDALDLVDGAPIDTEPQIFLSSLGYTWLARSDSWRTPDGRLIA